MTLSVLDGVVELGIEDPGMAWALAEADRLFARCYLEGSYAQLDRPRQLLAPRELAYRLVGSNRAAWLVGSGIEKIGLVVWPTDGPGGWSSVVTLELFTLEDYNYLSALDDDTCDLEGEVCADLLVVRGPSGDYAVRVAPYGLSAVESEVYRYLRDSDEDSHVIAGR